MRAEACEDGRNEASVIDLFVLLTTTHYPVQYGELHTYLAHKKQY